MIADINAGISCYGQNIEDLDLENEDSDLSEAEIAFLGKKIDNFSDYEVLIIDCRYNFEYQGGHIKGALNINKPSLIDYLVKKNPGALHNRRIVQQLRKLSGKKIELRDLQNIIEEDKFKNEAQHTEEEKGIKNESNSCTPVLIFHCEYSLKRGPRLWSFLRSLDRNANMEHYPNLQYPEIYLLRGGYRLFTHMYPDLCTPEKGYISEFNTNYTEQAQIERSAVKNDFSEF